MRVRCYPVELVLPESLTPRSPGIHQSSIIRCIATEAGILKPEWAEELSLVDKRVIDDPVAITRICMGLAWEEWYIPRQLPEVVDHPGEMLLDGVYMTHDGEELTRLIIDGRLRHKLKLHEIKLTYKSINTVCGGKRGMRDWRYWAAHVFDSEVDAIGPLTSQWMWLAQTKGYCLAADTNLVDLHVLFVCGDYAYPLRPMMFRYAIEFTRQELENNWYLMMDYLDTHRYLCQEAA